jgi:hypothetical protein
LHDNARRRAECGKRRRRQTTVHVPPDTAAGGDDEGAGGEAGGEGDGAGLESPAGLMAGGLTVGTSTCRVAFAFVVVRCTVFRRV